MYTLFREIEGIFNSKKSNVEICPHIPLQNPELHRSREVKI